MSELFYVAERLRTDTIHDVQVRGAVKDRPLKAARDAVLNYCNENVANRFLPYHMRSHSVYEYVLSHTFNTVLERTRRITRNISFSE